MDKVFLTSVFIISISRTSLGSPSLTCNDVDPISTSTVQCSCYNPGGLGIEWHKDSSSLTQCTISNGLCFNKTGYTFAVDTSTSTYIIYFGPYSYTDCSDVSCSDLITSANSDEKTLSVDESNLTPTISAISEPSANHTDGNISFTTDCLFKARSGKMIVTANWTAVIENYEHVLAVDEAISEIGSCNSCSYDFASKFSIQFYHEEEKSDKKVEAHIQLQLLVDGIPISSLKKTTNNIYYVRGQNNKSNTVSTTLSSTRVNSVTTTGTGTNQTANPTTLSSVSILRESSPLTTVTVKGKKPNESYIVPFIIAGACLVSISLFVILCYCIGFKRTKRQIFKNQSQSGLFKQGQNKHFTDISHSTAF